MSDNYERYAAVRQSSQNHSSDKYFTARPQIDSGDRRKVFEAGFERAYDLRESELTALRSQVADQHKKYEEVTTLAAALRGELTKLQAKLDEQGKQEPVAYGVANSAITGKAHALMMVRLEIPSDAQYPQLWEPLYRLPPNTEAMIERARAEERERLGKLIHYPECWDTACYRTLDDALTEIGCSECRARK